MYTTDDELSVACREWQRRLLLMDWEIVCRLVGSDDIPGMGQVNYVRAKKQAILKILRQGLWDGTEFEQDQEKSLVHELLHLHFAWTDVLVETNSEMGVHLEVSVDSVARALVRAKRNELAQ